jgi:SAM-dependent methyltransferase
LIEVRPFDGQRLPYDDRSFDVVMFVDVLHHTLTPETLLREAARVARSYVAIKDHTADSAWAHRILSVMDWVGNARHNVPLPYNYQSTSQWLELWRSCGLSETERETRLRIYPWYADWLFGRNLHLLSLLRVTRPEAAREP